MKKLNSLLKLGHIINEMVSDYLKNYIFYLFTIII